MLDWCTASFPAPVRLTRIGVFSIVTGRVSDTDVIHLMSLPEPSPSAAEEIERNDDHISSAVAVEGTMESLEMMWSIKTRFRPPVKTSNVTEPLLESTSRRGWLAAMHVARRVCQVRMEAWCTGDERKMA